MGLDKAICMEESCIDKGVAVYGGPIYSPNSSVCLAAEHQGIYKSVETLKLVRIADSMLKQSYQSLDKNNIQSKS